MAQYKIKYDEKKKKIQGTQKPIKWDVHSAKTKISLCI